MKSYGLEKIKSFWDRKPCGTMGEIPPVIDLSYFNRISRRRYCLEPFIKECAEFEIHKGEKILEVGCGVGSDGVEFAKAGANYTAIDVSEQSLILAEKNFELNDLRGKFVLGSAENMPFKDGEFDFIYSWGVIHHTPNIDKAISEIHRVLKPGGKMVIMIYHWPSLVCFQIWLVYSLLKARPFSSIRKLMAEHHESPGTQVYAAGEAKKLFKDFRDVKIKTIVTPYDARFGRNKFLPRFFQKLIPPSLGFFMVIEGKT